MTFTLTTLTNIQIYSIICINLEMRIAEQRAKMHDFIKYPEYKLPNESSEGPYKMTDYTFLLFYLN